MSYQLLTKNDTYLELNKQSPITQELIDIYSSNQGTELIFQKLTASKSGGSSNTDDMPNIDDIPNPDDTSTQSNPDHGESVSNKLLEDPMIYIKVFIATR